MMWYWGGGVHWWGWLLGVLGMIVFWSVLLWALWYFLSAVLHRRPPNDGERPDDPKRILDERLARGEIDADEYRHLRDLMAERDGSSRDRQPAGHAEAR